MPRFAAVSRDHMPAERLGIEEIALGPNVSLASALRDATARQENRCLDRLTLANTMSSMNSDVEEFGRNLNHCTAPRPRASRRRGMQSS